MVGEKIGELEGRVRSTTKSLEELQEKRMKDEERVL